LADLGLHDYGQITVRGEGLQVQASEHFQLSPRRFYALDFAFRAVKEAAEGGVDGFAQDVVFVFEVEIYGAVGDPSSRGYLGDACVEEAMLCDDFDCCVEDAQVLAAAAGRIELRR
jgi:hypothetical protein